MQANFTRQNKRNIKKKHFLQKSRANSLKIIVSALKALLDRLNLKRKYKIVEKL